MPVKGGVDFEDPKLRVNSDTGSYDIDGAANFDQANFQLMDRNGRGFAKDIDVLPDGKVALARCATPPVRSATRTGCCRPPRINLDTKARKASRTT